MIFRSMDLQQAINSRRTIHSFNTKKVSDKVVERAILAANQAPCHRLTFPWRFTSIARKERILLANLALEINFGDRIIDSTTKAQLDAKILNPSHLIVASQIATQEAKSKLEDYAACACAIQNLLLSLAGDAVGSKWSTGKISKHESTYKIVDIDPLEEEIIGFIWIGYGTIPTRIKRPIIQSIFRSNEVSKPN